jgi:hypothetical protein
MKTARLALLLLVAIAPASAGPVKTFYGEISDTQCAMKVHSLDRSHKEMIKKRTFGTDAASCSRACVRLGGEWALRDGDAVYHLKNQAGMQEVAGQKVKVTGTLDPETHTIDNLSIEAAPGNTASTW